MFSEAANPPTCGASVWGILCQRLSQHVGEGSGQGVPSPTLFTPALPQPQAFQSKTPPPPLAFIFLSGGPPSASLPTPLLDRPLPPPSCDPGLTKSVGWQSAFGLWSCFGSSIVLGATILCVAFHPHPSISQHGRDVAPRPLPKDPTTCMGSWRGGRWHKLVGLELKTDILKRSELQVNAVIHRVKLYRYRLL